MCKCEKEVVYDKFGDVDLYKNSENLAGTELVKLTAEFDLSGFFLEAGSSEANAYIVFRPKFCPFCGRKLRNDIVIEYIEA